MKTMTTITTHGVLVGIEASWIRRRVSGLSLELSVTEHFRRVNNAQF